MAALVVLTLLGGSGQARASGIDPLQARVEEAVRSDGTLPGLAAVIDMAGWLPWRSADDSARLMAELATTLKDPVAAAFARYQELLIRSMVGKPTAEAEAKLGFMLNWWAVGPFSNDGGTGLEEPMPPDAGFSTEATYQGSVVEVRWRELGGPTGTGYFDLQERFFPSASAVIYAASGIELPRAATYRFWMAIDGGYRLWIDGRPVVARRHHLGGFFMRDFVDVPLGAGRHTVVVKLAGADSALGFHMRVTDTAGQPVAFTAAEPAAGALQPLVAEDWREPGWLGDRYRIDRSRCRDVASEAMVLQRLRPADPSRPWAAAETTMKSLTDCTAADWHRLSLGERESWVAQTYLDRAMTMQPSPEIRLDWATYREREGSVESRRLARAEVEAIIRETGGWAPARHRLADFLANAGFAEWAFAERKAALDDNPDALPLLRGLLGDAVETDRFDLEARLREQIARLRPAVWSDVEGLIARYVSLGRQDEAKALADRVVGFVPRSMPVRLAYAEYAWAAGDPSLRAQALQEALGLCPDCAEVWRTLALDAVAAGDEDGALEAAEAALARSPQDPSLRVLRDNLADTAVSFWRSRAIDDDTLLGLRDSREPAQGFGSTWLVRQRAIEVYPNGLAETYVRDVAWVHNRDAADRWTQYWLSYEPDAETATVQRVAVFKPDGSVRESFSSREFDSDGGAGNMYFQVRSRRLDIAAVEPGDAISVEYTVSDTAARNIFDDYFGDYWPVQSEEPTALVDYAVLLPSGRTLNTNFDTIEGAEHSVTQLGETTLYELSMLDVPGVPYEAATAGPAELYAYASVSTAQTWDELGTWYWHLVKDQLVLTDDMRAKVAELVAGKATEAEKVAAIQNFVVRNTRYVGLEFGIHGYKPYRTSDIFQRRFGDCKDTASLMKVLLKEAGIDARLVLLRTRDLGRVRSGPPSLALFNHAIAYVPSLDRYLDGTANYNGSNELPSSDQGASALEILDGRGGRWHEIPFLSAEASRRELEVDVNLTSGAPTGTLRARFFGSFAPGVRRGLEAESERLKTLTAWYAGAFPGLEVSQATVSGVGDLESTPAVEATFSGGSWLQRTAAEWTVRPFGDDSDLAARMAGAASRNQTQSMNERYTVRETYRLELPEGTWLDAPPEPLEIDNDIVSIRVLVDIEGSRVTASFSLTLHAVDISPDAYEGFRNALISTDAVLDRVLRFKPTRGNP
jgi:transglutaminase-like putative cysteine protease